ncbi:hypothetical protein, partial [Escherichia coli]|uniref:hypothetical protein n=1 Tax=Escherichia coli TaxID=562 RepID=UPI001C7D2364
LWCDRVYLLSPNLLPQITDHCIVAPRLQNQVSGLASCNTSLTTQYFVLRMVTSQWWDRAGAS